MRPSICVTLLAACLSVRGLCARTPAAGRAAEVSAAARTGTWSVTVSAYGPTREAAWQAVLDEAVRSVRTYLLQRVPALRWLPPAEKLEEWVSLKRRSDPKLEQPSPETGFQYKAELTVEVSDRDLERIVAEDHQERAREGQQVVRERQILSAKVLAALVTLLAAVAGYFRLEELTRGYYTGLLRVLLLLCVAAIGAGLWLIL